MSTKAELIIGMRYWLDAFRLCSGVYVGINNEYGPNFRHIEGPNPYEYSSDGCIGFPDDFAGYGEVHDITFELRTRLHNLVNAIELIGSPDYNTTSIFESVTLAVTEARETLKKVIQ